MKVIKTAQSVLKKRKTVVMRIPLGVLRDVDAMAEKHGFFRTTLVVEILRTALSDPKFVVRITANADNNHQ